MKTPHKGSSITPVLVHFLLLASALSSCLGCGNAVTPTTRTIACDFAFSEPITNDRQDYRSIIIGDIMYTLEERPIPNTIMAFDLMNRHLLWRASPYADIAGWKNNAQTMRNICVSGASIFAQVFYDGMYYLLQLDRTDGTRKKAITLGKYSEEFVGSGGNISCYGSKIFLFFTAGLCYCDVDAASVVDADAGIYAGTVVCVNPFGKDDFGSDIDIVNDDIIYSFRNRNTDTKSGFIRFDPDTMRELWRVTGEVVTNYFTLTDNKLITVGYIWDGSETVPSRFDCRDWATGALLASYDTNGSGGEQPPLCLADCYIQTGSNNNARASKSMLYCLEANTLALRWKVDVDVNNPFYGSNCQVNNGIVYLPRATGLWLYDQATGALLGKDESFMASDVFSHMPSYKYGELLVISNGEKLLGIKMNFKKRAGALVKE